MLPIKPRYLFLVVTILFSNSTYSESSFFHKIKLIHGISIDVPTHWRILSQATRKNINTAGQSMIDNSSLERPSGRKETLLAMNALPRPAGAMIRISVTSPPDYTQDDLNNTTKSELKEIGIEMLNMFRKLESSGLKIIEMQPTRIEKFGDYSVLVMSYVRAGLNGPSPWQVTQYKIPVSDKLIELTLSYRKSDSIVWIPILERVKRSLIF
jgi:hypothetical protein